MKTNSKIVANILACAVWADGVYDEAEKITVEEIAEALQFVSEVFNAEMNAALETVNTMDETQLNVFLGEECAKVDATESEIVLEAVIQLVISDNVFSSEEAEVIHTIASSVGVSEARTLLLVADMVSTEPELEIEF